MMLTWGLWMVLSSRRCPYTCLHTRKKNVIFRTGIKHWEGMDKYCECSLKTHTFRLPCVHIPVLFFIISSFLGGLLPTFKTPWLSHIESYWFFILLFCVDKFLWKKFETPWISKATSADERHHFNLHQHILPVKKEGRRKNVVLICWNILPV